MVERAQEMPTLGIMSMKVAFILTQDQVEYKTEQNINLIDINCTVSCQIHEYNITANPQMVIIDVYMIYQQSLKLVTRKIK